MWYTYSMNIPSITAKYCDYGHTEPPYSMQAHIHTYWELVYYRYGTGTSTVDGIPFNYLPNTYVIIPAGTPHAEKAASDTRLYIYGFEVGQWDYRLPNMLFLDRNGRVLAEIQAILEEYSQNKPYMQQKMSNHFQNLFIETLRMCTKDESKIDDKLEMLVNYIDNYATTDIDFRNLANSMAYSYDYLRHYFKQKMGVSMKQYAMQKRIDAVKQQLVTDMSIGEIADACGFYSTAHLTNAFVAQTGMSPTAYRKARSSSFKTPATILVDDQTK